MIPLSIRLKLTLWYGAALCAILAFFSAATYLRYREAAWRAFDTDLAANLDTLQGALAKEIRHPRRESSAGTAQEPRPGASALERRRHAAGETLDDFRLNGLYAEVREGPGGETFLARLAGAQIGGSAGLLPESAWKQASVSPATRFVPVGSRGRAAMRSFQPEPGSDPIELAVADRTTLVDQTLASIERSLIEFGTIGLVLALAGGYWLATRALRPIDAMTTQAGLMASEASSAGSHRLEVIHADDELGRLALTFNRLLERIEASVTQLRGFIADAAHELKTPVAVVRAEAELSLSADRDAEGYRETLRAIAGESEQLSRVISDLTLLAEGETLDHPLERRLVDLKELAHEVTRSLRAVAAARNVVFDVESSGCVEYRGDERLLRQILTNLFENAIKFSRSPGRIGVVVSEEPADIEIRVLDEAPTLSPEERVRVFDRFYRAPQPKGIAASGTGLGLAIVRWAVVLHGGTIRVEPRESGGNLFVVTLPLPADAA
ncbi:MAG: sensor histidine kinase [Acidobacteriota bacterium]